MKLVWLSLLILLLASVAEQDLRVVVDPNGAGDFKTIQMAVDHAPVYTENRRLVIELRPGHYHERVKIPQDRPRVTLLGSDSVTTYIEFSVGAKDVGGTFFSSVVEVNGAEFRAKNITFQNSYGVGTQAVAISIHSDRAIFEKCRFLGWQDTVYSAMGRQYFVDCYIEGHVDFIFGNASAVFDRCEIHSKGAGYITAHSRTSPDQSTGYVFLDCKLTGDHAGSGVFLGRPWRPYARVVYVYCQMGDHIRSEGWDNWNNNPANEKTAWYSEIGSTGPGARSQSRVSWARPLTPAQAADFYPRVFLRGSDGWDPTKMAF